MLRYRAAPYYVPQVGLQLRNADPALMRDFVVGMHEKAAKLGSTGGPYFPTGNVRRTRIGRASA